MKKLPAAFLMLLTTAANGADPCASLNSPAASLQETYTIDRRENADWSRPPYNSIIKLIIGDRHCTATKVSDDKVLTARHCLKNAKGYNVSLKDKNNNSYTIKNYKLGNDSDWAILKDGDDSDWAILKADMKNDIPSMNVSKLMLYKRDVERVGFGSLKILSDQEIRNLRQAYACYLYKNERNPIKFLREINIFFDSYEKVNIYASTKNEDFVNFRDSDIFKTIKDHNKIFRDSNNLKISKCQASLSSNKMLPISGCQNWGGDSGGPFLYQHSEGKWNLIGISVTGSYMISNDMNIHAQTTGAIDVSAFLDSLRNFHIPEKQDLNVIITK
jgi:hypothetical protein